MNESNQEGLPEEAAALNPYASPGLEVNETPPEYVVEEIVPTANMIWGGILLGVMLQLAARRQEVFFGNDTPATLAAWSIPALATGTMFGLGFALLLTAIMRRSFAALLPGHWFLIAFLPKSLITLAASIHLGGTSDVSLGDEIYFSVPENIFWYTLPELVASLVSAIVLVFFYFTILLYSREPQRWKVVAGTNAFYWTITIAQLVYFLFISQDRNDASTFYWMTDSLLTGTMLFWILAMLASLQIDRRQEVPRSDFHWIGIAQLVALPILSAFTNTLPYVVFR